MQIGIIGVGLIGGSMAIDLKKRKFAGRIVGVEVNPLHAHFAEDSGLVDRILSFDECIETSDLIIVALPPDRAMNLIPDILDRVRHQVVTDVCSTKEKITNKICSHLRRKNFVAAHPMAGTEYSGPQSALSGLFDGRTGIICDREDSDVHAVELIESLYDCLNMRVTYMSSSVHDEHVAYVSHISHITSFALALTVFEREKNEKHIFDLASGGFTSTVRLAKSSADMWIPIFLQNRHNILAVLDTYIDKLDEFKMCITMSDEKEMKELIYKANEIKRIIE